MEITELNKTLRERYKGIKNIRHYQGLDNNETHGTVYAMPNTSSQGRIFIGYTADLLKVA